MTIKETIQEIAAEQVKRKLQPTRYDYVPLNGLYDQALYVKDVIGQIYDEVAKIPQKDFNENTLKAAIKNVSNELCTRLSINPDSYNMIEFGTDWYGPYVGINAKVPSWEKYLKVNAAIYDVHEIVFDWEYYYNPDQFHKMLDNIRDAKEVFDVNQYVIDYYQAKNPIDIKKELEICENQLVEKYKEEIVERIDGLKEQVKNAKDIGEQRQIAITILNLQKEYSDLNKMDKEAEKHRNDKEER
jgi:hypothetical protein